MAGVIEGLVVNGVREILKKLIPVITEQIGLASGAKDELEKLKNTLEMIEAVVTDAERRQITEEAVKLWLRDLKDIAYEVDDILDAYLYGCMQKHVMMKHKRDQVHYYASPSTNPFLSRFKLGRKIKKINLEFDLITFEKNQLDLQPYASPLGDRTDESINRTTYAFLGSSEKIVGRETDKRNILKMLLPVPADTHDQVEKVTVIPIVGMGGIGKTTLAQLVYNDESVGKHFDLKIWVCVSDDDFNIKRLLKKFIESITRTKCDDLSNIDVLEQKLRKNLGWKKYLLVLDDMWNRNGEKWVRLKDLLAVGAQGSKIIITTRIDDVAKIVAGNNPIYNLEGLKKDDCRSIFKKLAFGTGGPVETLILSNIANELVKKCKGLPLAMKILGSLMHSKKNECDWLFMSDYKILGIPEDQHKIFRILKLSYDHLPFNLKQCFSYCAIFPKDYIIKRETLIQLWMAEGFIQPYDDNDKLAMEDIGNDYFFSLLRNSLLQDIEIDEFGNVEACKMHDLVHDLAQAVAAGTHECLVVEASKIGDISEVRRLHLLNLDDELSSARVLDALKKAKKLRTLIVSSNKVEITSNIIKNLFHSNTLLRVLDLSRTSLEKLPSEISNLKHLRYLDLPIDNSRDRVVKLPDSISTLYHLQTLRSPNYKLPKDTSKLINLRHVIACNDFRSFMPRRLGQLTRLKSIGGNLSIYGLENVKGDVARSVNLEDCLWLEYPSERENDHEMLLEGLQPHPHLKSLYIDGFGGAKLPTWMGLSSCLPNLVMLRLFRCNGVEQLPSLGELPLLRMLYLQKMEGVRCLGKEFHGTTRKSKASFPSLMEFSLDKMINLEEWVVEEQQQSLSTTWFPHLKKLVIGKCHALKVIPTIVFPSLTELSIDGIKGGMTVGSMVTRNLTSLTEIRVYKIKELQFLPQVPLLLNNSSLEYLNLESCPALTFLPDFRHTTISSSFPHLKKLEILCCRRLKVAVTFFPSLKELYVGGIRDIIFSPTTVSRKLAFLVTIYISEVEELQFLPQGLLLNNNSTLQRLTIRRCPKFEGFVISKEEEEEEVVLSKDSPSLDLGGSNNSSLKYLNLLRCPVLKFLPDLRYFTSLRTLIIQDCKELVKSLPDEDELKKCLPSLEELRVKKMTKYNGRQ